MDAAGSASLTPAFSAQTQTPASAQTKPQSITTSPALDPHHTFHQSPYNSVFTLPLPAFESQQQHKQHNNAQQPPPQSPHSHNSSHTTMSPSASTLPTIMPSNKERGDEATPALLILNQDWRESKVSGSSKRTGGISVKDLLSC